MSRPGGLFRSHAASKSGHHRIFRVKSLSFDILDLSRSHHVLNIERGPVVSVWTNYSGLRTEPGRRPEPKHLFQPFQWFQTFQWFDRSISLTAGFLDGLQFRAGSRNHHERFEFPLILSSSNASRSLS